jgi:hypothetical protein
MFVYVCCASILYALTPLAVADDVSPSLDDVRVAWEARQDACHSVRYVWIELETTMKGVELASLPEPNGIYPAEDTKSEHRCSLSISEMKIAIERRGPYWSTELRRFEQKAYRAVFDGAASKNLYSGPAYPMNAVGFITSEVAFQDRTDFHLRAVALLHRPLVPALGGIDLERWTASENTEALRDLNCLILTDEASGERLWLDVARGFLVVRQEIVSNGSAVQRLEVEYTRDTNGFDLVQKWENALLHPGSGTIRKSLSSRVVETVVNEPIGESEFDIKYPANTIIRDDRDENTYRVDRQGKLVLLPKDIQRSSVAIDEDNSNGIDNNSRPNGRWTTLIIVNSVLALLLIAGLLCRRLYKSK